MQNSLFVRGMLAAFVAAASIAPLPVAAGPVAAGPVAAGPVAAGPVAAGPLGDAQALVGHTCPKLFNPGGNAFPGYAVPKGFVTVTLGGGWVFPMEKGGNRFAFLITGLGDVCKVNDVVTLPDKAHADAWFQCHAREALVEGFGMRLSGHKDIVAWWTADRGKLKKMADTKGVICQQPETGD